MEEKKIIIPLQEWDETQREIARLRSLLDTEREKFKDKAQCILLESKVAELGMYMFGRFPAEVYTDNVEVLESVEKLRKFIDDNLDYKAELEHVKSMSVWRFLMMKLLKRRTR